DEVELRAGRMLEVRTHEIAEGDLCQLGRKRAIPYRHDPLKRWRADVRGDRAPDVAREPAAHADVAHRLSADQVPHRALRRVAGVVVALAWAQRGDVSAPLADVEDRAEAQRRAGVGRVALR